MEAELSLQGLREPAFAVLEAAVAAAGARELQVDAYCGRARVRVTAAGAVAEDKSRAEVLEGPRPVAVGAGVRCDAVHKRKRERRVKAQGPALALARRLRRLWPCAGRRLQARGVDSVRVKRGAAARRGGVALSAFAVWQAQAGADGLLRLPARPTRWEVEAEGAGDLDALAAALRAVVEARPRRAPAALRTPWDGAAPAAAAAGAVPEAPEARRAAALSAVVGPWRSRAAAERATVRWRRAYRAGGRLLRHALPLALAPREIGARLGGALPAAAPAPAGPAPRAPLPIDAFPPREGRAALLASLRAAFFERGRGVLVTVRAGRVRAVPFANEASAAPNGPLVHDAGWRPRQVWSERERLGALLGVVRDAVRRHAVPDVDFVLDPRDCDARRPGGGEVVAACGAREGAPTVLLPPVDDVRLAYGRAGLWFAPREAGEGPGPALAPEAPRLAARPARAVFRGSLTGAGNAREWNARWQVVEATRGEAGVDAGLTRGTKRTRVAPDGTQQPPPPAGALRHLRAPFLAPEAQRAGFRAAVYVEGNGPAYRLGWLLSEFAVLGVQPLGATTRTWLTPVARASALAWDVRPDSVAQLAQYSLRDDEALARAEQGALAARALLTRGAMTAFVAAQLWALARARAWRGAEPLDLDLDCTWEGDG